LPQSAQRVADEQERTVSIAPHAFVGRFRRRVKIDGRTTGLERSSRVGVQDAPTTGTQDNPVSLGELINQSRFAHTKCGFPFDFKDGRDADSSALFKFVIGIEKWHANALCEHLADGCFARAHQADQEDVLRVHT